VSSSYIHQFPTAWNSSWRYTFDETSCAKSFDLEYIICGDRVRVYALEKERPGVPFKASASAFHNEAFRKGFEGSSDRVSFKV
jgi:hypothetical protein